MKSSLDIQSIIEPVTRVGTLILRYHLILTFLIASALLIFSVITVNSILTNTGDLVYQEEQQVNAFRTKFDPETIEKINSLKSREENASLTLPAGRINPFKE